MALALTLKDNLSETISPHAIALDGTVAGATTEIAYYDVLWRWADEPDMKLEFLGTQKADETLNVPFDPKGRQMVLKWIGYTDKGVPTGRIEKEALQTTFTPTTEPSYRESGAITTLFQHAFLATTYNAGVLEIANDNAGNYYSYLMPAGTLLDGESLILEYSWNMLGLGNKAHWPNFGGYSVGGLISTDNGNGRTVITFQRQGTTIRYNSQLLFDSVGTDDIASETLYISGLDLDTTDVQIAYYLNQDNPSELFLNYGMGYRIPAPFTGDAPVTEYLTDGSGEILFDDSGLIALTE